jgi:serine/threonine-protein kinase
MSLFRELKRRNVYRVAALYVIVSWVILQVVDVFTSFMPLPEWTGRLVFLLLLIGFPVALVLAWAFELTPQGLRREARAEDAPAAPVPKRGRAADFVIYGLLIGILGYLAWQHDSNGRPEPAAGGEGIRSLAVLPFEDLMNDPGQAWFAAGMLDSLIGELSNIEALHVISRTSAMRYADSNKSIPEIARELGVDAVVEGSVFRDGETVRISVQLIEAQPDRLIWSGRFDRQLSNILALYREVTREIAGQVRVTLTPAEQARIDDWTRVDPTVYGWFLEGSFLCDNWSPLEMEQGMQLLEKAIERDPGYAPAHARLALCLQYAAFFNYLDPLDILERSHQAAETAVRLDETLAEAHVARAGIEYYLEFNPREALRELNRALELEPANVRALMHASWLLGEAGHFDKAIELNRKAIELDPMSMIVAHALAQVYYLGRDFEQAARQTEQALSLDRNDPSVHYFLALPNDQLGRFRVAQESYRRAIELSDGAPLYRAGLAYSLARAGQPGEARRILGELRDDPRTANFDIALIHLGLGETDEAVDRLEKAYASRDSQVIYINRDPRFDPLRGDARFDRLIERLDYPPPGA